MPLTTKPVDDPTTTDVNEAINPATGLPWTDEEWEASGNPGPNPAPTDGTTGPSPAPAPEEAMPRPVWQDYAVQAIHALYPNLREDVDFAWGRASLDEVQTMTHWSELLAPADMAKIQAAAEKLMGQDPKNIPAEEGGMYHAHTAPSGTDGEAIPPKSQ